MNTLDAETDPRLVETDPDTDSPCVQAIRFEEERMVWEMVDGRVATAPLAHWPTIWLATKEERETFQIARCAVHWPLLDADIASDDILHGCREHRNFARKAWCRWMDRNYAAA